jgi:predicted DsbA family dithiol-disulfide isomerase
MKIEIWSDVMCPFCYIGKRKFEAALEQFADKDKIEVEWKSFQLQPNLKTEANKSTIAHLAESKGWSLVHARQMTKQVTDMAAEVGLHYDFDKAIVANSFDAHRLSHLAKKHGVQDALEEALFKAYFTEGKNTADHEVLTQLGESVGLEAAEIKQVLESDRYADDVNHDIYQAQQVGARGVPFFVLGSKYAVSGAQPVETFKGALNAAWTVWKKEQPLTEVATDNNGAVCSPEDGCEI